MSTILRNPTYAKLFGAQIIALLGTGLLTVALGLLAFDIAGGNAGIVVGFAMTIKMVAYVAVAPIVTALTHRLQRKSVLIAADLIRAIVAVALPFVTEAWQIYILIFCLQAASATFTPTFQAVLPAVLPDEDDYTLALSFSRLAYDLESLISPVIAAALLTVVSYHNLFVGTVVGFLGSAALVIVSRFPRIDTPPPSGFVDRLTKGVRVFWAAAELRSLLALNLVVATTTGMVLVNTVVVVKVVLDRGQSDVAVLQGAYGAGSMIVALALPTLLGRVHDRTVMFAGATVLPVLLASSAPLIAFGGGQGQWFGLLILWLLMGAAISTILTPSARLLRRNSDEENRAAVFSAQFSLSHACFLITYPTAGVIGTALGLPMVAMILAGLGAAGAFLALSIWPRLRQKSAVGS